MRFLVTILGALLGGLLGIVGGIALSLGFAWHLSATSNSPGADAPSLITLLFTVPGGCLFGMFQGIDFAMAWVNRRKDD